MSESAAVGDGEHAEKQPTGAERVAAGQSAPEPTVKGPASVRTRPAVNVRQLRHPSEPSRFALAASASIVLVGLGLLVVLRLTGILGLAGIGVFLFMILGSIWWAVQVHRVSLLGAAARVTPETFPELSVAVDEVKQQLGYTRSIEIFVVARSDDPVQLTSFFGTHVLLIEGDLVAEVVKPENRPQLDFILATFFGMLMVKRLAWAPILIAIAALKLPRVLNFFVAPWERATVYTGDQVAATCCGSLDESIIALNRLLVGKDLARSVGMTGLMNQAVVVRQQMLPRMQQLYSSYPHMTNRYLNLISFADQSVPEQARTFHERLAPATDSLIQNVLTRLTRLRQRGPKPLLVPVSLGGSIAILGLAAFGIFSVVPPNDLATAMGTSSKSTPSPAETTPRPAVNPSASIAPSTSPPTSTDPDAALEAHIPPALAATCTPQTATVNTIAAIACQPSESDGPEFVYYYQYADSAAMKSAFKDYIGDTTESGTCNKGGQRGTYNLGGPVVGSWACYYNKDGEGSMIWTTADLDILAVATDSTETPQQLHNWFFSSSNDAGPS